MFCSSCGNEIETKMKYCPHCGQENVYRESDTSPYNFGGMNDYINSTDNSDTCIDKDAEKIVERNELYYPQHDMDATYENPSNKLDVKTTSILGYMTWIGFLVAIIAGDREGAKFYLNQALVFNILLIACVIPVIGWLWGIFMLVCFILGVIWAAEQQPTQLPLIGMIHIID